MAIRRSSLIVGTVGIVLIVAAIVVRFVVVPAVSKLPSNTNLSIQYAGTGTSFIGERAQSYWTALPLRAWLRQGNAQAAHGRCISLSRTALATPRAPPANRAGTRTRDARRSAM